MSLKTLAGALLRNVWGTLSATCSCCNYYCCYEYAPDPDPEAPLPPTHCQNGPCAPGLTASGPHSSLAACSCECCQKTICHERVYSTYQAVYGPFVNPCQPDPVNDNSPGTVAINWGNLTCGNTAPSQFCTTDWGSRCAPLGDLEPGDTATLNQYYERFRAVDHCDDCMDDGGAFCVPGVSLMGCFNWNVAPAWMKSLVCSCAAAEDFCDNPLP